MLTPLFDSDDDKPKKAQSEDEGYVLRHRHNNKLEPISKDLHAQHATAGVTGAQHVYPQPKSHSGPANAAVELIRQKVQALYSDEPNARQERAEVMQPMPHRSKHQQFMYELSTSGKSLAQIQTEWHNYYLSLPDHEKHEVWQEFYQNNARQPSAYASYIQQQAAKPTPQQEVETEHKAVVSHHQPELTLGGAVSPSYNPLQPAPAAKEQEEGVKQKPAPIVSLPELPKRERRNTSQLKKRIVSKVLASEQAQQKAKQHFHSLLFGLGTGFIVLIVFLFGFFNEMIIAPFIQPSRHVSATPIIVSSDTTAVSDTPEVIIPKINVEIPTVFDATANENDIENNLEKGVVHYPTTVYPGQQGNTAFFGHSSNNIFNPGQYKFAFVLLHTMVPGDIFYLTYNKTIYTYRVFDKKVVAPSEVSVLDNVPGKTATATLITCDPPGTSNNRLIVWGEQISPDPATATAPTQQQTQAQTATTPTQLPDNGPTLWNRVWTWVKHL